MTQPLEHRLNAFTAHYLLNFLSHTVYERPVVEQFMQLRHSTLVSRAQNTLPRFLRLRCSFLQHTVLAILGDSSGHLEIPALSLSLFHPL